MRPEEIRTPCYVVQIEKLKQNLEVLRRVERESGAHILLAQKAFSMFSLYPLIGSYLSGTTASGLYEARLGAEEMPGGQVHVYAPAYRQQDVEELCGLCDHIVFNTPGQWKRFAPIVRAHPAVSAGLRVNPGYSEIETPMYDPCRPGSRLGTPAALFWRAWDAGELEGLEGLHFHTMCEQNADVLERTLDVVEETFGGCLHRLKWLNMGGGHHITRPDYDTERLIGCVRRMRERYGLEIYLEPGEAVALQAGYLLTRVLDVWENDGMQAILDASAACHMPDVLEMPYRPQIEGAGEAGEKPYTYRLGGPTCLAGDTMGIYSFAEPLREGSRLKFLDMAIYTMVKNHTFNGMPLPSIAVEEAGEIRLIREFDYRTFKERLS